MTTATQGICMADTKLYRLDLSTLKWDIVKTKTQPPGKREEHAGVLYKGNLLFVGSCFRESTNRYDLY